jgi:hypothetical protein
MAAQQTQRTHDHETIRRWAEQRDGHPARVKGTGDQDEPGVLRIDFQGYAGDEELERISWDAFFRKFDDSSLDLVYQEHTSGGERSNFNKLVERDDDR